MRKRLLIILSITLFVATGVWFGVTHKWLYKFSPQEHWMTIFVHGSFGSILGFLNFSDVISDHVYGTEYQQITAKMRNDDFFFRRQAILQQGLIPFEPSLDARRIEPRKFAIYPIVKAYEIINDAVYEGKQKNYFYAFGWSGLLSQTNRRSDAIRFYNALCAEVDRLRHQGIHPKIRIITHSHGGNLALNLAAVHKLLTMSLADEQVKFSSVPQEDESLREMATLIKKLPSRETARTKFGQEIWDYVPVDKTLVVDELIMFASPMQPETECFCNAPIFKRVFNLYSGEDWVQRFDWVSSKHATVSRQRLTAITEQQKKWSRIVQARIMVGRPVKNDALVVDYEGDDALATRQQEQSLFDALLKGRNVLARKSKDPTHKEMWFLMWNADPEGYDSPLFPLPTVVMTPLIVKALDATSDIADADVDVDVTEKHVVAYVAQHNQEAVKGKWEIDKSVLTNLQNQTMALKPTNEVQGDEFNVIYQYLQ
ncbi:MAG: hypothetical protein WCW33_03465 [Candidatus Babeliales bacterium]|jgi:hypothetical protein